MQHRNAELWFRNADAYKEASLTVVTYMDLLTSIAGVPAMLLTITGLFLAAI
jgi:hypothetical protein